MNHFWLTGAGPLSNSQVITALPNFVEIYIFLFFKIIGHFGYLGHGIVYRLSSTVCLTIRAWVREVDSSSRLCELYSPSRYLLRCRRLSPIQRTNERTIVK